jgi:hypothetical protein
MFGSIPSSDVLFGCFMASVGVGFLASWCTARKRPGASERRPTRWELVMALPICFAVAALGIYWAGLHIADTSRVATRAPAQLEENVK